MLCVAYETLARRGELVALKLNDIDFHPDGTGIALIRRGKTDAEGQGRSAYLSRETVRLMSSRGLGKTCARHNSRYHKSKSASA